LPELIIKESIKLSNKDELFVQNIVNLYPNIEKLLKNIDIITNVDIIYYIRKAKKQWEIARF